MRQSQVVRTYGPGSLVDLPEHAVIVGGLDHWTKGEEILEPRLVQQIQKYLGPGPLALHAPPPDDRDAPGGQTTGIRTWVFPEWFITQDVLDRDGDRATRSRRLVQRIGLERGKWYIDRDKKKKRVVPVRFVRACRRGHIGDLDWFGFVHRGDRSCRRALWMEERGTSGDLSEVWVSCECGEKRPIIDAARADSQSG